MATQETGCSMNPADNELTAAMVANAMQLADRAVVADVETEGIRCRATAGHPVYDISFMFDAREHSPECLDMASQAIAHGVCRGLFELLPGPPMRVRLLRRPAMPYPNLRGLTKMVTGLRRPKAVAGPVDPPVRPLVPERKELKMSDTTEGPMKCWALHIEGPDDLMAAPSKNLAQFAADVLNKWFDERPDKHAFDPIMRAKVVEWDLGYERWKASSEQFGDQWAEWVKLQDAARAG